MSDEVLYHDIVERELFIDLVAKGTPPNLAGIEVGWTPRRTNLNMADPEFIELVRLAQDRSLDSVELAVYELAVKGKNLGAMQMILYNRRPEDWKDVRRIEVNQHTSISVSLVSSVKEAAMALMRENGPAALQPGGLLDGDVTDADIVEDE